MPSSAGRPPKSRSSPLSTESSQHLAAIFAELHPRLLSYALARVADHQQVLDLVQDTWIALARALAEGQFIGSPAPYLFKTLRNRINTHWSRRKREETNSEELRSAADRVPDPLAQLQAEEDSRRIQFAVQFLEDRYREIVYLHYFAGLAVKEIADGLRQPEGTVKRLLHEARARLAAKLCQC